MKWYHYISCFVAGVFLIHILPHALNGLSLRNALGIAISLAGGLLFLWLGKFSWRNPLCILYVVAGMVAVLIFTWLHPHHHHHSDVSHLLSRSKIEKVSS